MNIKEECARDNEKSEGVLNLGFSGVDLKKPFHQGYVYGKYFQKQCQRSHNHSKTCSKVKDIDLADLQSKAFKFMILQKPKVSKQTTHLGVGKPYQASFLTIKCQTSSKLHSTKTTTSESSCKYLTES